MGLLIQVMLKLDIIHTYASEIPGQVLFHKDRLVARRVTFVKVLMSLFISTALCCKIKA